VRKVNADHLDIELPVAIEGCLQSITLAGQRINHWRPIDWNVVRLPLEPDLYTQPVVLDLVYKLPASFAADKGFWRSVVHPPIFRPEVLIARQRWDVTLPSSAVGILLGKGTSLDYTWGLQNGLLAPRAAVTSEDLDAWLTGKESTEAPAGEPSLAFDRLAQTPVAIFHLPWKLWLLSCSGTLLLVGISLLFLPLPRSVFWLVLGLLGLALLMAGLLWPATLPALVFGCEPGLLILLLLLGVQWLVQERYRRQVVFMPGFSRSSANSSHSSGSGKRPREVSTVDAPAPSGVVPSPAGPRQA
jgi:hypothetical protein